MPIFKNDASALLDSDLYSDVFERKGVKFLKIRRTKDFSPLSDVELEVMEEHIWTRTDTLLKLSYKYYNTSEYWWALGILNAKPTDAHFRVGDVVMIPKNPSVISERMRE